MTTDVITTEGYFSWTCPPGVFSVDAKVYGAGGAGSGRGTFTEDGGGGGGGGAYTLLTGIAVNPNYNYGGICGRKGVGGTSTGGTGWQTIFNGENSAISDASLILDVGTVTFNHSTQATTMNGISFKPDGTKMFLFSSAGVVYQYSLSSAFDITSATYDSVSASLSEVAGSGNDLFFSPDGLKMYVLGNGTELYQYDLGSAWSVSTVTYTGHTKSFSGVLTSPRGMFLAPNGIDLYINSASRVSHWRCDTPWDISTVSEIGDDYFNSADVVGITFSADGKHMFLAAGNLYQVDLTVEWLIATGTANSNRSTTSGSSCIYLAPNNSVIYWVESPNVNWFGLTSVMAKGGRGAGPGTSTTPGTGGAGGASASGFPSGGTRFSGGTGGTGRNNSTGTGGGGGSSAGTAANGNIGTDGGASPGTGGAAPTGGFAGANGANTNVDGPNAAGQAAGGGGSGDFVSGGSRVGGNGSGGRVELTYTAGTFSLPLKKPFQNMSGLLGR